MTPPVQLFTIAWICAALAVPSVADEGHHHDDINEQQLGIVHFPTSCAPKIQKTFERGVALLHSFAFETAETVFRQVAQAVDLATTRANLQAIQGLHTMLVKEKRLPISINAVEEDQRVVSAWIDHAEDRNGEAVKTLREIAAKEQGIFAPDGGIPAHEMLGDILSEMGKPEQALTEYGAELKLSPNRFDSLYGAGRAAEMAKLPDKANGYYKQLVKVCAEGNSSRPELAYAREFLSTVSKQN